MRVDPTGSSEPPWSSTYGTRVRILRLREFILQISQSDSAVAWRCMSHDKDRTSLLGEIILYCTYSVFRTRIVGCICTFFTYFLVLFSKIFFSLCRCIFTCSFGWSLFYIFPAWLRLQLEYMWRRLQTCKSTFLYISFNMINLRHSTKEKPWELPVDYAA